MVFLSLMVLCDVISNYWSVSRRLNKRYSVGRIKGSKFNHIFPCRKMLANMFNKTPKKPQISLVTKGDSVVPMKNVDTQTILEKHGYKLGDLLGEGSFAKVKVAQSRKHGRPVAIKIIDKQKTPKDFLEKFMPREVKIMIHLKHRYIIEIYETFETDEKVYIVMEYGAQGDMLKYLNNYGAMEEEHAKRIFFQFAKAMEFCQSKNIAHRDLKPQNLLLNSKGNLKVTDFGFATHTQGGKFLSTFCGTPDYAAPEILGKFPYNGFASDVWSMGVTLYAMLNRRMPFTPTQIKRCDFKDEVEFGIKVSKDCENLVRAMLTEDPKKRPKIAEILESPWLKSLPKKKKPQKSSSNIHVTTSNTESNVSEYESKERRGSTLVSDVVNAAKGGHEGVTKERHPIDDLINWTNEEKALEALKESRAAWAAQVAAEESKDQRRKSIEQNHLNTWKVKYAKVAVPAGWDQPLQLVRQRARYID